MSNPPRNPNAREDWSSQVREINEVRPSVKPDLMTRVIGTVAIIVALTVVFGLLALFVHFVWGVISS